MFWGTQTLDDAEERSFGGYTDEITVCEKYTKEEAYRNGEFHEYNGELLRELNKIDEDGTWIIKIVDLSKLGRCTNSYIC